MLVKDILAMGAFELKDFPSKHLESRVLLAYVLNLTEQSLLIKYNDPISNDDKNKFFNCINRRKLFEPIAYITGKKEFYSLDFLVNHDVLIPRADTELLVDSVIKAANTTEVKILDLGTGSGAVAIAIAKNVSSARIIATDISDSALKLAKQNAELNNVSSQIKFIQSDWYEKLSGQKFDFIVSNPPYISVNDTCHMSDETLKYEPRNALFADNEGLFNYEIIISRGREFLKNDGRVFLEIGFNQRDAVFSILKKYSFKEIEIMQDIGKNDRVISATI